MIVFCTYIGCPVRTLFCRYGPYTLCMADGQRFEMRVSSEWLARVDECRGSASRASFVKEAVDRWATPTVVVGPGALEQVLGEPHRAPSTEGIGTSGGNPSAGGVEGASSASASTPVRASEEKESGGSTEAPLPQAPMRSPVPSRPSFGGKMLTGAQLARQQALNKGKP